MRGSCTEVIKCFCNHAHNKIFYAIDAIIIVSVAHSLQIVTNLAAHFQFIIHHGPMHKYQTRRFQPSGGWRFQRFPLFEN